LPAVTGSELSPRCVLRETVFHRKMETHRIVKLASEMSSKNCPQNETYTNSKVCQATDSDTKVVYTLEQIYDSSDRPGAKRKISDMPGKVANMR
jgi:hypothetical protein